jgi:DNA-binding MarR family transcriptional regulator
MHEVLAREVAQATHGAAIHLLRRLRKQDVATGIPPARLSALSVLVFAGPHSLGQLAAVEQVRPATMSKIVAALVASGFAATETDARDQRSIRIRASARGARVLKKAAALRLGVLTQLLQTLSHDELDTIRHAMTLLRRLLATK